MKKYFIPLILFIGICVSSSAQEKSRKEKRGDKFTFRYSYDKAIEKYTSTKKLSVVGQRRLAENYHKINLNTLSEEAYSKLINNATGLIPEDYYNYSMVLKINGKYDQAFVWMEKFKELKPNDLRVKDYTANKDQLASMQKDDGKYKIEHLTINSKADDFGTSYYKSSIVFSSSISIHKMIVRKYNWNRKPFWNMFVSEVDGKQLKTPKNFDKCLNGKFHDGPASFSNNGTFKAFTKNNLHDKSIDKVVELQIWFSSNKDGKWAKPEPFALNSSEYSVGQPCLSADGNTMYFTSDMPGGYGKADIYKITKIGSGQWGVPVNLGDKINTEGDEMFPYYDETNKLLYFSSNGRFGLGGLDIFVSAFNGSGFNQSNNMGFPLNTNDDDFAVIVNDKMTTGYFSSNRAGGSGGDDIFSFDILKDLNLNKKSEEIAIVPETKVRFYVNSPKNIPVQRRVREYFPVRNYIFFDLGSTEIPDRYVLLKKDQVKDFKEDQLEVFKPKYVSGRSERQLTVYYNVLNILGDRMGKNPSATITLVGSSEKGTEDGLDMAQSVKTYLVNIFGITATRINLEGTLKPKIPAEQPGDTKDLEMKRSGDRRVSIESSSSILLMEFQSGPDAPLKPVEIVTLQEAPVDSYLYCNVDGGNEAFISWSLEIMDDKGIMQYYGPFAKEIISIPGKSILWARPKGDFKITMVGQVKGGNSVRMDTTVHMVLWTPPKEEEIMRFSIIYEFNESKAISIYEKYLTEVIIPKIPKEASVVIHGYTDVIGSDAYNQKLSFARANDVKKIFENGLAKKNRTDVKFDVYGFGEDQNLSPFENKFPEERFYNRTVIIDIIPKE